MNANGTIFEQVVSRYQAAFTVEMISTFDDLIVCEDPGNASELFSRHKGLDQFPVRIDGKVIGVVERWSASRVHRLEECLLAAAKEPLGQFLPSLQARKYMLVLRGRQVEGIVTRSDLTKLPVRLYSFSVIAHLEDLLAQLIEARFGSDSFKAELNAKRRRKFEDTFQKLKKEKMDPPPVEALFLCDKCRIVSNAYGLGGSAQHELDEIERMRNQVAHMATYANDQDDVCHFLRQLELACGWIPKLHEMLAKGRQPGKTD